MTIPDTDQKMVNEMRDWLLEHFDSVQIMVTRQNGGERKTGSYECGGGNFYARLGQIQEWISIQDEYQRDWARKHAED